jgi:hypothetical protein
MRQHVVCMIESSALGRVCAVPRLRERRIQFGDMAAIPPFGILVIPAAPLRGRARGRHEPIDLVFRPLFAMLVRTVLTDTDQGIHRSVNEAVGERALCSEFRFQEKLGA